MKLYSVALTGFIFLRSLSFGSTGDDVSLLQNFLNTQYGENLPVTGYFGKLTTMAVARFQEKNAEAILYPYGLTVGNGFVGEKTRAVLNSSIQHIQQKNNTMINSRTTINTRTSSTLSVQNKATSTRDKLAPVLENGVSQAQINAFADSIDDLTKKAADYSARQVSLVSTSTVSLFDNSPSVAFWDENTKITLQGKGFLPTSNTILTSSMGYAENIPSSDGATLTFSVQALSHGQFLKKIQASYKQATSSVFFWVSNASGASQKIIIPVVFNVQ